MNEENETKEKQEYLRINILEKGYNADEFMEYLQTLRGEKGLQIEAWSKNDLIKAVQEVIGSKSMNDCHVAVVITNNTFTKSAIELAEKSNVGIESFIIISLSSYFYNNSRIDVKTQVIIIHYIVIFIIFVTI